MSQDVDDGSGMKLSSLTSPSSLLSSSSSSSPSPSSAPAADEVASTEGGVVSGAATLHSQASSSAASGLGADITGQKREFDVVEGVIEGVGESVKKQCNQNARADAATDHRSPAYYLAHIRAMGICVSTYSDELVLSIVDDLRLQSSNRMLRDLNNILKKEIVEKLKKKKSQRK
jgi:hypothetical protein